MINNKQIDTWAEKKIITQAQAQKLKKELEQEKKELSSNRILAALTTVGAILLGVGAILFISSNWQEMGKFLKIAIITGSTFISYFTGYYLRYEKKIYQTLGTSLIFLAALLFGASIILISQIYHIDVEMHWLILAWLVGILPLTYGIKTYPFALLSVALIYTWFGYYLDSLPQLRELTIFTVLFSAIAFYAIGNIHHRFPSLKKIGNILTFTAFNTAMFTFFFFTFPDFVDDFQDIIALRPQLAYLVVPLAIALVVIFAELLTINHKKEIIIEKSLPLVIIISSLLALIQLSNPTPISIFYNLAFFGLGGFVLYSGYQKHNTAIIRIGMIWITIFIIAKYFDFFWDLLDRSIFFLSGGVLLIIGSIFFEKQLNKIKSTFNE